VGNASESSASFGEAKKNDRRLQLYESSLIRLKIFAHVRDAFEYATIENLRG